MRKFAIVLLLAAALVFGCAQQDNGQVVGGDKDEHGCIGSAGYTWCGERQKCLRTWEEGCAAQGTGDEISNFDECAAAGNPVMESYPRRCSAGGKTFTEEIDEPLLGGDEDEHGCKASAGYSWCGEKQKCLRTWEEECEAQGGGTEPAAQAMTEAEAREIAGGSACAADGTLKDSAFYNEGTGTWWFDLEPAEPHDGCNPACVVSGETKTAETNWRCTGLLPG